jgi:hypothetical protein
MRPTLFQTMCLPPETNVFCNCLMLIHELRAVDEKGYIPVLVVDENGYDLFLPNGSGLVRTKTDMSVD